MILAENRKKHEVASQQRQIALVKIEAETRRRIESVKRDQEIKFAEEVRARERKEQEVREMEILEMELIKKL